MRTAENMDVPADVDLRAVVHEEKRSWLRVHGELLRDGLEQYGGDNANAEHERDIGGE
jgi:hypothetical protein